MFDPNSSQNPGMPVIRQWEEAGASLAAALSKYLDLCISLGPDSQKDGTPPKALAIRINTALQTLHTQLEHQLDQSRSVLAQTRNQLQSPISHFPSEILSEIFSHIIFDPVDRFPVSMEESLTNIYQSVHNLLGVCSTWKNVVLARGLFWSIVPVIEPKHSNLVARRPGKPLSAGLSMERSGNADLHLAAIPFEGNLNLVLTKHSSRFRSINILSESIFIIGELLDHFIKSGSQFQVSELSLCYDSKISCDQVPPERTPLSSVHVALEETKFKSILGSLSVLRLSDISFDWSKTQFSPRLVELELRKLTLGSDQKFAQLLTSLSSATELHTIKLSSIVTRPSLFISQNTTVQTNISFPKLQTMVVRNLFFNTLDILLSSIKSRSHRLTLHLTSRTFEYTYSDHSQIEKAPARHVIDIFRQVTVNTLLLEALEHKPWLSGVEMRELLNAMPNIETLHMHNWDYPTHFCKMFKRPNILDNFEFPRFKNMHLTQARIRDEEAFRNMVASYSRWLERMELAGTVLQGSEGMNPRYFLEGDEPIVAWFKENVSNFKLTSNYHVPLEFRDPVWQL